MQKETEMAPGIELKLFHFCFKCCLRNQYATMTANTVVEKDSQLQRLRIIHSTLMRLKSSSLFDTNSAVGMF